MRDARPLRDDVVDAAMEWRAGGWNVLEAQRLDAALFALEQFGPVPEMTVGEALEESRRRAPVPKYIPADNEAHSEPSGTEIAIRDRFLKGETVSSLADRFDLLQSTVREIVSGALS